MEATTQIKAVPATQHTSLKHIWRRSLNIYITHFVKIASIAAIPHIITAVLWAVLRIITPIGVYNVGSLSGFLQFTNPYAIIALLLLITTLIVTVVGIVALIYTVVHHEQVKFIEAFENSLHYILPYIGQQIIATLVGAAGLILGAFVLFGIGIVLGFFSIELFTDAYSWLSLIIVFFGVGATVLVIFAQMSVFDKGHSAIESIRFSIRLTRGHFWRLYWQLLFMAIIIGILGIVLAIIPFVGPFIALLTLVPFTLVYIYVLYAGLVGIDAELPTTEATS